MIKILYIFGYIGRYGGEKANIALMEELITRGARVDVIVSKALQEYCAVELQRIKVTNIIEGNFGYDLLSSRPSAYELFLNIRAIIENLVLVFRSKILREVKYYDVVIFPNYIQLFMALPMCLKADRIVMRVGDTPDLSRWYHHIFWKLVNKIVKEVYVNSIHSMELLNNINFKVVQFFPNKINKKKGLIVVF
jgi:hypothetical protein